MTSQAKTRLSDTMRDAYRELAKALDCTPFKGRGAIRKAFENFHGVSQHTVYRGLDAIGWSSGNKKRKDAGTTAISEDVLIEIESATRLSVRANGKDTMKTSTAISMLVKNGRDIPLSASRINQLRRQRNTTTKQLNSLSAHQRMRSLYANHVHQVDPSYCLLYYPPGKKGMKVQKFVDESDMYANKPENLEKIKNLKCWRYVLTDHFSGSIIVKYYQSAGETSVILWDFLLYCWQTIDNRPFRGVPTIMVWDKGSANTSSAIKNALKSLQIEEIAHMAKNPRAKGQVESSNNIVELQFESRLKFEPVSSVEELNTAVEAWYNAYNANLIPRLDTRLRRRGMLQPIARYDLWQTILRTPEKLRELPPLDVCRYLLKAEPKSRQVDGHLEISFVHPKIKRSLQYSLRDVEGVYVGEKVMVSPIYYGNCQIMVAVKDHLGAQAYHALEPREYDEQGFAIDAPVWGEEIVAMPDTIIETRQKAADAIAYPGKTQEEIKKAKNKQVTPFEGTLNAHSHLKDIEQPVFMKRQGAAIDLPGQFTPAPRKPLSRIALKKAVKSSLGRPLKAFEIDILAHYENVFDEDVAAIVEQLSVSTSPITPLKLVNK